MSGYAYERLSQKSASLIQRESSRCFGHAGAILVFEPGPLSTEGGGVDIEAVRTAIQQALPRLPRYRSKLRRIPFENHPVWVDDPDFNLRYHLRHTSLPRPGNRAQLREVAARLQSQRLDRGRPLWECWVVEGLEGGRFALVTKTHTALLDGRGGDLLQELLRPEPEAPDGEVPAWRPRPMPSPAELFIDEVLRRGRFPRRPLRRVSELRTDPEWINEAMRGAGRELARLVGLSVRDSQESPLTGGVGPHRRFDHLVLPLADARRIRARIGGSINDILLSVLAGAVGRYLRSHFVNPATLDFLAAVPVRLQAEVPEEGERKVGEWIVELPIWEPDPIERLRTVLGQSERLSAEGAGTPASQLASGTTWTGSELLAAGVRAFSDARVGVRFANLPGPQSPLYLAGARLEEAFGKVPLTEHGGLGVCVQSYDGKLCWGINADFDRVADLPAFTEALRASFEELLSAATEEGRRLEVVQAS